MTNAEIKNLSEFVADCVKAYIKNMPTTELQFENSDETKESKIEAIARATGHTISVAKFVEKTLIKWVDDQTGKYDRIPRSQLYIDLLDEFRQGNEICTGDIIGETPCTITKLMNKLMATGYYCNKNLFECKKARIDDKVTNAWCKNKFVAYKTRNKKQN